MTLAPPTAAAQKASTTFGVDPAPGSSVEQGFFSLHSERGGAATQAIRVSNETGQDADIRLAPVDATTAQQGGVAYGATGAVPTADGAWITLDKTELRLPAGTRQDVGFRISVPSDARPGVHLAGIIAYSPDTSTAQTVQSKGGAGAALYIESRRAIAVQITLPGPDQPRLTISGVTTDARPNGLNLLVAITNEGNGLTKGKGHLTLSGPASFSTDFDIDTVVPRTSFSYPVVWTKEPKSGTYHVKAVVDYGTEKAVLTDDIVVGAPEQAELRNRVVPPDSSAAKRSGPPLGLVVILSVAGGAAVALIGGGAIARRRRSHTPPPE